MIKKREKRERRERKESGVSALESYHPWNMILSQSFIVWLIDGTAVATIITPNITSANTANFGIVSPPFCFRGSKED